MEIKKIEGNIEFTLKLFFCKNGEIKKWAINLMSEISKNIPIHKDEFLVQYPWEYEKDGIYIIAIEGNAQKLSYFVFDYNENTSFAFLQDGEILENLDTIKHPEMWLFEDENVETQLDKLGFEWERKLIWKDHEINTSEENTDDKEDEKIDEKGGTSDENNEDTEKSSIEKDED